MYLTGEVIMDRKGSSRNGESRSQRIRQFTLINEDGFFQQLHYSGPLYNSWGSGPGPSTPR